jgi:glycosyltransferase involved in cell wall biosynthesis
MRIVTHVVSLERLGGLEVNTLEATRALLARGHEVHVLYGPPTSGGPSTRAEFEAAGAVLHGPFPFASRVLQAPRTVPTFLPAARLVAELRPDVVWLQRPEHVVWGQTVARWSRTPLVSHLHHVTSYGRLLPWVTRGVTRFIAVSEFIRDQWTGTGVDGRRIDVVHNAVPADTYPPGGAAELNRARRRLGLPADLPLALLYGQVCEGKGVGVALDAWARLAPSPAGAHLVVVGDVVPDEPRWRTRLADAVAAGTVTWLPNQADVVPLLHAADLVLFPSLLQESFGRVALEALMTHRPVLASAIGAVPEVLTGDLARLLVPPGDAAALADGMAALLDWRRTEPGLGAVCGAQAARRFDFDGYVTGLEQSLARAAGDRVGRRLLVR